MRLAISTLAIVSLLSACADNSGGPPPEGEEVEFERVALGDLALSCGSFRGGAALVLPDGDATAVDALCPDMPDNARDALLEEAAGLDEDAALIVVNVETGGCVEEHGVVGFFVDGDTVNVWTLIGDAAYQRPDLGCPAIAGEATSLYRIDERGEATRAELVTGVYNPDLPGAPALPGQ